MEVEEGLTLGFALFSMTGVHLLSRGIKECSSWNDTGLPWYYPRYAEHFEIALKLQLL